MATSKTPGVSKKWLTLASCAALAVGCASTGRQPTPLMERAAATEISASELRARVRALAAPFSGLIEESADRLIEQSDEADVRRHALLWKIHQVPAMQAALFQPDPLAALIDAWVLTLQMKASLEDVERGYTETERAVGERGLDRMLAQIEELVRLTAGDPRSLQARVEAWAREHPIRDTVAARTPTAAELARFTADARIRLRESAGLVVETRDDLAARADVYVAYLPKQARWQAELLVSELLSGPELGQIVPTLAETADAVERMSRTVEVLPGLVTSERRAVLEAVSAERLAVLEALESELGRTMAFVTEERRAIFEAHVAAEREAIVAAVSAERIAVLEALHQERVDTLDELEGLAMGVIDRIFLRLAQLGAVVLVVIALAVVLWLLVVRPRTRSGGSPGQGGPTASTV